MSLCRLCLTESEAVHKLYGDNGGEIGPIISQWFQVIFRFKIVVDQSQCVYFDFLDCAKRCRFYSYLRILPGKDTKFPSILLYCVQSPK